LSEKSRKPDCISGTVFPKQVRIGGMAKRALLRTLRDHNISLNKAAEALFNDRRFVPLRRSVAVEIAFVSVADMGFTEGTTYERLTRGALDFGLVESPLELGPQLRLQFLNQPEGAAGFPATEHRAPHGSITVASAPLDGSDQTPKGFYLRRIDGVLWLRGYRSWSGHIWSPQDVVVFSRRAATGPA
jgi:hypothetical protein